MNPPPAGAGTLNPEHLRTIISELDQRLASISVRERNDRRMIAEAEKNTAEWYNRVERERGAPPLDGEAVKSLLGMLEAEAPGLVAKRNAEDLVRDLDDIEAGIPTAGLNLQDERRLRSEIEDLRRNLLRGGRYLRQFDDALVRMAAHVRKARGAWADDKNLMVERYLGRDRWWLG